jgi:hypothetical protein
VLGLAAVTATAVADPEPIPQDLAVAIAKMLTEKADAQADAPIKLESDPEKATGLHKPEEAGLMVVPRKDLKVETVKGVEEANGMPTGYLFLYRITPVVDGKAMPANKLPTVTFKSDDGTEREIVTLRLALKKENEETWKLLVFGKEKKPLVASTFRAEGNSSELPLSVSVKDVGEKEGTLVVTVFGKYAADVKLGKAPE